MSGSGTPEDGQSASEVRLATAPPTAMPPATAIGTERASTMAIAQIVAAVAPAAM